LGAAAARIVVTRATAMMVSRTAIRSPGIQLLRSLLFMMLSFTR
jgi:hypothetical protein